MQKSQLLVAVILISFIGLPAQSLPTLLQAIPENNLALKAQEKTYYATLESAAQINPRPDPEVGLGLFPLPVETRLGPQALRLSAMQRFPWFGAVDTQKEVALAKAAVVQEEISVRQLTLQYQVEQAYYQLYEIVKSKEIIQRNLPVLEALERLALAKVESGSAIAADVLRVQLQREMLQQEIAILQTEVRPPTITINQILNRPIEQTIVVSDSLSFAILALDKEALYENLATYHPLLKMYGLQQEVSQKVRSVNDLADKPSFGVGVDYIFVNKLEGTNRPTNGRDVLQVKAVVQLPLYKGKYESKDKEELLKIEALDYQKADAITHFKATIEKAYSDYESAKLKIELYEKQIALTQATTRILEADYSANGNNFDELLSLQLALIEYDLKIVKAIVQSHLAKSTIEQYFINQE